MLPDDIPAGTSGGSSKDCCDDDGVIRDGVAIGRSIVGGGVSKVGSRRGLLESGVVAVLILPAAPRCDELDAPGTTL